METEAENKFRAAFEIIEIADALTAPLESAIENLLRQAAAAIDCDEASIIVRDGDELRFSCVVGKVADKLRGVKIPQNKGIAGFVFASGQPLAIADAARDANFYAEIDRQTGFSTETILATPLRTANEIVGVLEFVNRVGAPPFAPFTSNEMDRAAVYAEAIAALVDAQKRAALNVVFAAKICADADLQEWLENLHDAPEHSETLELALLIRRLSSLGEAERRLSREILESCLRYAESAPTDASFLNF